MRILMKLMQDPENKFKVQFSNFIFNAILQSLEEKLLQLQYNTHFQFQYNRRSLQNMLKEQVIKRCVDL